MLIVHMLRLPPDIAYDYSQILTLYWRISTMTPLTHHSILIVGASRGLGHAMAAEFLQHGWNVIGTVRDIEHPYAASPARPG
ncbi:short chain dehydrogenase [Raoultella terrigena]|uniref:Short chain dehydrogenase n=1 Tax=Raoultella terrigena TaxID=577 RepID=A0A4U9CSU4_RAOTE|nr:short chain dehydrogenase [Raoultella terrigena]